MIAAHLHKNAPVQVLKRGRIRRSRGQTPARSTGAATSG